MAGLPLWLDLGPFRVVHACWSALAVRELARLAPGGVLPRERLLLAGRRDDPLNAAVETLTKGPEHRLPDGLTLHRQPRQGPRPCPHRLVARRRADLARGGDLGR